ncbi:pilus assembly protein CpaF [Hespellia stercorisuis DSM 15480]|uniref:Pilus assembly protein CpaF n=1 Tax=Hespellia stercorisuis DSM 15480 TaxID=1121950 RepID=A0A1M6P387_9FIRM|nr:ATPase, T2SS/T4P/T4SS family [Hespellia stercorisuis]SHK02342.1 pilus assembly protein CpaF [Hespellia stercorisuis DSM 15480]
MIQPEELHRRILREMDLTREIEDEDLMDLIYRILDEKSREEYLPLQEKIALGKELFNAFRKLDILQELIEDEEITEIMINGTQNIFLEKNGRLFESDKRFVSTGKLEDVIQQIVSESNRFVNESSPIVDARLKDGSRVNVVLNPVALNGPIVTIRKFPKESITMEQLIKWETISREVAEFLQIMVNARYNIFISGGTGSGKTTFLNALSHYIPKDERIITIEDNAELQIKGVPNLVRLEARNANVEGAGAITIQDIIKSALRMRPDRIIVGEVRGAEAIDMLQAMNTGHLVFPS